LVCTADDTLSAKKTSTSPKIIPKGGEYIDRQGRTPPDKLEVAVGMKVMITENLDTDLDITNGARGIIVGVTLHPDEPPLSDDSVVHLHYLPVYILVRLHRTRASKLPGLDDRVIPIEAQVTNMKFTVHDAAGIGQRSSRRRQFPSPRRMRLPITERRDRQFPW
jgi:hypothetical protein